MVVNLLLLFVLGLVDLYGVLPRGMVVKVVGRTVGRNFGYSKHFTELLGAKFMSVKF